MLALFVLVAAAEDLDTTTLGEIHMPITPHEEHDRYTGVFEHNNADLKRWTSDTQGFQCLPRGDFLEIVADRASWPREIPSKVTCTADDGRKVKSRVLIDTATHKAMFIADGTLVMPRKKGNAVLYVGPPSLPDLVVQHGQTGQLNVRCEVKPGPELRVTADSETEDGEGQCALRNKDGEFVRIPVKVVTAP
jgi:hypothetical protein